MQSSIYSGTPWLMPADPPGIREIFCRHGRPFRFEARQIIPLGDSHNVYFIDRGIAATFIGGMGEYIRLAGIFPSGTTLGGIKAVSHPDQRMLLEARTLCPMLGYRLDTTQFRKYIGQDAQLYMALLRNYIAKDEATIEGALCNDLLPIEKRLAIMVKILFLAEGAPLSAVPRHLPCGITVTELATLVHGSRISVSRILSGWLKDGTVGKDCGGYLFSAGISARA